VARAEQLLAETREALEYFDLAYKTGNIDFLFFLAQEVRVTETEIKLLDAERNFYVALAAMQAALGLDPLEQSLMLNENDVVLNPPIGQQP
jgi:outer membrane protein TolC